MFDIEKAVATWRRFLASGRGLDADDLDELEAHLRDEVDTLLGEGLPPERAFRRALGQMGDYATIEAAYETLLWRKARHERRLRNELTHRMAMLKNYLKIALRNLQRQPGYAFINVAGLAVGLTVCLLILLFVQRELSYDDHHAHADRIVRVTAHYFDDGRHWAATAPPLANALEEAFPEVEKITRIYPFRALFRYEDRAFNEPNGVYADSTVFDVFTLPLLRGDPETALTTVNSVVLSASMARKYFGDGDPIGRQFDVGSGWRTLTVSGVMADPPATTHLPFDYLISFETWNDVFDDGSPQSRTWAAMYSYLLLRTPEALPRLEAKMASFEDRFLEGLAEGPASLEMDYVLQPLADIHLHSHLEKEYQANSDITYVYIFSVIALFVLLIACVNFINLATARAARRTREVGVRKALGAHRGQLALQFLGESMVLVGMSLVLAGGLLALLLPVFNHLTGQALDLGALMQPRVVLLLLGLAALAGLIAGSYPALVLSGFRPSHVLRGQPGARDRGGRLRKSLVVFQFAVSICLIASTFVVLSQLDYFRTSRLGFDKEHVLTVRLSGSQRNQVRESLETVREELLRDPAIEVVSFASDYPGERYSLETMHLEGQPDDEGTQLRIAWGVDHEYVRALGLDLVAGRDFSRAAPADTNAWLLNEAAVRRLGLEAPLGQVMRWNNYAGPIVGVVKDFHFASLHNEIEPLVIPLRPGVGGSLLVRTRPGQATAALAHTRAFFDRLTPNDLFDYTFLDQGFDQLYRNEARLSTLFGYFSGIAIFIACLGLFGLASFTAEQRTKELGVRKVLGATTSQLVRLLSKDFILLVLLAFLVAAPISYFAMQRWLEDFAYRVEMGWGVFALAGGLALVIALATVSYQALRAATADPVEALRYE